MSRSLEALEQSAQRWVGTPWCDNSAVLGRGVCCHRLVASVYVEAGWLPRFEIPDGAAAAARGNDASPILDWFLGPGSQWFEETNIPMPGDAVLMRIGHAPHHLGLYLPGDRMLHVTHRAGVQIVSNASRWTRHLFASFTPRP